MIEEIEQGMILYTQGNKIKHDVAHFLKVHQYARLIGKLEHIEKREQEILEVAAIVHDIACPMCREKYGNSAGYLQEQEGPALVKDFLKNYSLDKAFTERVAYLVGHHLTKINEKRRFFFKQRKKFIWEGHFFRFVLVKQQNL